MLPLETLILLIQLMVLLAFNFLLSKRSGSIIQRHFHPFAFFTLFYFLFFITPQFIAIFPPFELVGLGDLRWEIRKQMISQGQLAATVFLITLISIYYTYITYTSFFNRFIFSPPKSTATRTDLTDLDQLLMAIFFAIGMSAIIYLGITFSEISASSSGFRSQLVKSAGGKIATSLSYFGNFAFSVLLVNAVLKRNWTISVILALIFGSAILMTGSRGRLMWPLLLSGIMLMNYYNRFDLKKVIIGGILGLFFLLLIDPLVKTIRTGNIDFLLQALNAKAFFENMFFRRNFDGLSNLSLTIYMDETQKSVSYLFTGARDAFMNTYFPDTYATGVGFGVTYPGWLYLSGGWPGIIYGGVGFGFILGFIHSLLFWVKSDRLYWTYLFMMPWLCGVGGNFVESFDKLLVAISPGILWIIIAKLWTDYKRRRTSTIFTV